MFIHNYLVDHQDIERLKAANASANFSMLWRQHDLGMQDIKLIISPEKFNEIMSMAELDKAGILVTGSSDYYVSQIDPLAAITAGITGKAVPYYRNLPYKPYSQPVMSGLKPSLETMVKAYTINAAKAQGIENLTGSIEVGKKADIIILNKNIFALKPIDIYGTEVELTMFDGEVVHGSF